MLRLFISLLFLCLTACEKPALEFEHTSLYFGTLIDTTLYDVSAEQADAAFRKLDKDFEYMHRAWSPWERGALRRTNGLLKTGKSFSIDPSTMTLIKKSMQISSKTDYLYNPAIGNLINLWQFHKSDEADIQPPAQADIDALLKSRPRLDDIHIDGIKIQTDKPSVSLNFGAFAKGYGIDLEIQMLKTLGIKNAIISAGGDLKTMGSHGDRPWQIAIQHPRKDTWLAKIAAQNEESIFTSGDYERYYEYQGKRYHHILDPRTGYPAEGAQSVTVIHTDSGLADAAATALFVAGPDKWLDIAKKLQLKQVMLIDDRGTIHVSPAMKKRLKFNSQIEATIKVTPPL